MWTKAEKVERMLAYLSGGHTQRQPAAPAIVMVLAVMAEWLGDPQKRQDRPPPPHGGVLAAG